METIAANIPGYSYGSADVAKCPVSMPQFEDLKTSVGFTEETMDSRKARKLSSSA